MLVYQDLPWTGLQHTCLTDCHLYLLPSADHPLIQSVLVYSKVEFWGFCCFYCIFSLLDTFCKRLKKISHCCYLDDIQFYTLSYLCEMSKLQRKCLNCPQFRHFTQRADKFLQLNEAKPKLPLLQKPACLGYRRYVDFLVLWLIPVRNLGINVDAGFNLDTQIRSLEPCCFYHQKNSLNLSSNVILDRKWLFILLFHRNLIIKIHLHFL